MAEIKKNGDIVILAMTVDEAGLLQKLVEDAGNVAARARHSTKDNSIAHVHAEISMRAMWELSNHLDVPTGSNISYNRSFRLP